MNMKKEKRVQLKLSKKKSKLKKIIHQERSYLILLLVFSLVLIWIITKGELFRYQENVLVPKKFSVTSFPRKVFPTLFLIENSVDVNHAKVVQDFYEQRSKLKLSILGNILYKNASRPKMKKKMYKISIWKFGKFLERRHLRYFQRETHSPFEGCPVNNCVLSYENRDIAQSDAVVFLMHRIKNVTEISNIKRSKHQRWIFLSDESPKHTFLYSNNQHWKNYSNLFNWSMTYRTDSDVPVPYGRTVPLRNRINYTTPILNLIPYGYQKRRDVLVAIMVSNCGKSNNRMSFLKELQKYIKVDVYGACGTTLKKACPGHFTSDCPKLNDYLFYLAFENSDCEEYMTEKLFWNAYSKGAIPIIMGSSRKNSRMLLPPNSYMHVEGFARPADLARYLKYLNNTWHESISDFHQWRRDFQVINEHGYFGSKSIHYCRICEALNYNDRSPQIYSDLSHYFSRRKNCKSIQKLKRKIIYLVKIPGGL